MDDDELREPNVTLFDLLSNNYTGTTDQSIEQAEDITEHFPQDPAFDLGNGILINFASNITGFLE